MFDLAMDIMLMIQQIQKWLEIHKVKALIDNLPPIENLLVFPSESQKNHKHKSNKFFSSSLNLNHQKNHHVETLAFNVQFYQMEKLNLLIKLNVTIQVKETWAAYLYHIMEKNHQKKINMILMKLLSSMKV